MKLSLVVPCFNEEENIIPFAQRVREVFDGVCDYEIIYVDDGSADKSAEKMKQVLSQKREKVKIISFSRNFGKEPAMYAGLKHADGEYTAIIDCDLQQDPAYVLEMKKILDENPDTDCVCAYQEKRRENAAVSALKSGFYGLANRISEVPFRKDASDFRVFRRGVLEAVLSLTEYKRFSKGIFSFVGFQTEYIPYEVHDRAHGKSKWPVKKLFSYAADGIFAFSVKPLSLATVLGTISLLAAVVLLIVSALTGNLTAVRALAVLVLAVSGGIYICLGILGKYVSAIYMQAKDRPVYIVRDYKENF